MAFEDLLATVIPSLRYVYEYKRDIDFYFECCDMAEAKRKHHENKMLERIETLNNIIEDLECKCESDDYNNVSYNGIFNFEIDYNMPYCVGEKNKAFYSIIDSEALKAIKE